MSAGAAGGSGRAAQGRRGKKKGRGRFNQCEKGGSEQHGDNASQGSNNQRKMIGTPMITPVGGYGYPVQGCLAALAASSHSLRITTKFAAALRWARMRSLLTRSTLSAKKERYHVVVQIAELRHGYDDSHGFGQRHAVAVGAVFCEGCKHVRHGDDTHRKRPRLPPSILWG